MKQEEAKKWCESQDVVKIICVKVGEEDKFTYAVGQYGVVPLAFDSQEEAEKYLEEHFKFTNLELAIIGAMCQRLNELNNERLKNKTK